MGTDITVLKLLAALLAYANLYREEDEHWILSFTGKGTTKGSKLDKVANELVVRSLIEVTFRGRYVVTHDGMERLTQMVVD